MEAGMILKRIGPLSLGKIMGILYGFLGIFIGIVFSGIGLIGYLIGQSIDSSAEPIASILFGIGGLFILPLLYGLMGFLSGVVTAAIYNVIVKFIGGLELEFEEEAPPPEATV